MICFSFAFRPIYLTHFHTLFFIYSSLVGLIFIVKPFVSVAFVFIFRPIYLTHLIIILFFMTLHLLDYFLLVNLL